MRLKKYFLKIFFFKKSLFLFLPGIMAGDICRGECIQHLLARGVVWCQLAGFDLLDTHGRAHAHRERDGLGYQGLNRVGFGVEAVVAVLYLRGCQSVADGDACQRVRLIEGLGFRV